MTSTGPLPARSAPSSSPIRQQNTERVEEDVEGGTVKGLSFTFWKAFAREDLDLCRQSFLRLVRLKEIDSTPFSELLRQAGISTEQEETTEQGGTRSGKYILLPSNTPRKVVETWCTSRATSLMRLDPKEHCLAFDGDVRKDFVADTKYFIACAQRIGTSPDACAVGTHTDARRPRMVITEPTYAVRVAASSPATKPKILAGISVNESRFPQGLIEAGFPDILEDLQAPPAVWFALLISPPSSAAMEQWYTTRNTEDWSMTRMRRGSTVQDETNEEHHPPLDI